MRPHHNKQHPLWKVLGETRVVRFPRHRLATFGPSEIQYQLVTAVSAAPMLSNLRTGRVIAQRPQILTPESFLERFKNFGEESNSFERFFKDNFSDSLRGLEYTFQNVLESTVPHHLDPRELARNIRRDLDARDATREAVILGPESGWGFALMKFILEETSQSFSVNLQELDERGFFDPDAPEARQRREVEALLRRAEKDPSLVNALASLLHRTHLFDEYQDQFFRLIKRS